MTLVGTTRNVRSTIALVNVGETFLVYTPSATKRAIVKEVIQEIKAKAANIDFGTLYILPSGVADLDVSAQVVNVFVGRQNAVAADKAKAIVQYAPDGSAAGLSILARNTILNAGDALRVYIDGGGAGAPIADDFMADYQVSSDEF